MTSLHETLPLLERTVPTFADKLDGVAREAAQCEEAARTLVEDLQKKRARATELAAEAHRALVQLDTEAGGARASLASALAAAEASLERMTARLETAADAVGDGLSAAGAAINGLQAALTDASGRAASERTQSIATLEGLE